MSARKSAELSPESIARSNRKRLAADGMRALADVARQAIEVHKNVARLREVREAKEAADEVRRTALPAPELKKRARKLLSQ